MTGLVLQALQPERLYWYATGRQTPTMAVTDEWGVTFRSKTGVPQLM